MISFISDSSAVFLSRFLFDLTARNPISLQSVEQFDFKFVRLVRQRRKNAEQKPRRRDFSRQIGTKGKRTKTAA